MRERIVDKNSSQKRRRTVVLTLYILLTSLIGWHSIIYLTFKDSEEELSALTFLLTFGVIVIAIVVYGIIYSALRVSVQQIATKGKLDERERTVRDNAYRLAYHIVTGILLWTLLYAQLASQFQWWLPQPPERMLSPIIGLTLGLVLAVTSTLPTSIIAWNEPDPEPEEAH